MTFLKIFDTGKRAIIYCHYTCHRHTQVFGVRKAWASPIGTREIDGLPKASMAELLVTKQDPNSCSRVGFKKTKKKKKQKQKKKNDFLKDIESGVDCKITHAFQFMAH